MGRQTDNDLGDDPDDPHEPPAVNGLEDPPPDAPPPQEPDRSESLEPELTSSAKPSEKNPAGGLSAPDDSDQHTSETDEHARPLTDREWAEHLTEVRDGLDWSRRQGLQTHRLYTIDSDKREWSTGAQPSLG